jgi:hypothetical protein
VTGPEDPGGPGGSSGEDGREIWPHLAAALAVLLLLEAILAHRFGAAGKRKEAM